MDFFCARLYIHASTNRDTTKMFPFLAIFEQIFTILPQNNKLLTNSVWQHINIFRNVINYHFAKFYAFMKTLTIEQFVFTIIRWTICGHSAKRHSPMLFSMYPNLYGSTIPFKITLIFSYVEICFIPTLCLLSQLLLKVVAIESKVRNN